MLRMVVTAMDGIHGGLKNGRACRIEMGGERSEQKGGNILILSH